MQCEWKNCKFKAETEELIYRHAIVQHTDQGNKPRCHWSDCLYSTTNRYRLKTHLKSHFSVKNYECRACGLQYKHRYNLSRHIRAIHSNIPIGLLLDDKPDTEIDNDIILGGYDYSSPSSTLWESAMEILFGGSSKEASPSVNIY